ncbi:MAG: selenocysteine-specific translation elongation factor [Actinomycetota bacterium]
MHVIGTAGHVDHGKSSLVERLTGIDPDRFAEEKRRGLTIDLGFAWLPLPSGNEIGIIDVPGHERFIKNMLAGAGGVSVCLFVVAANEGWKPQSEEHLAILDVLQVRHGVIALTKVDLVDAERVAEVTSEVSERFGATTLAGAPVVPCSSVTGAGIERLLGELDRVVAAAPALPDHGRPRLWVDRVFTIAGAGTVTTGTLVGGSFATNDEVGLLHGGEERRARIRRIQSHKKELPSIGPGNRVALNLVGLEREGAERGDLIGAPELWRPTSRVDAWVTVLPESVVGRGQELTEKGAHLLYVGSAETPVRVRLLEGDSLAPGTEGPVQLYLRDPLPLVRGDRFVLRDAGRVLTLGGGVVVDPLAPVARRRDPERARLVDELRNATPFEALVALVEAAGTLARSEALYRSGAVTADLDRAAERVVALGHDLVSRAQMNLSRAALLAALEQHHQARPLEKGAAREQVRAGLALEADALNDLVAAAPDVVEEGALLRLASHGVSMTPQQQEQRDRLVATIEAQGFAPPLVKELGAPQELLRSLMQSGELVKIGDFFLTRAQADDARARVRASIEASGPMTVAQIRDLLETTRKYAVPLCEWLDSTGATKRHGDMRALGPNP